MGIFALKSINKTLNSRVKNIKKKIMKGEFHSDFLEFKIESNFVNFPKPHFYTKQVHSVPFFHLLKIK